MTLSDSPRTKARRHGSGSFSLSWERAHRVTSSRPLPVSEHDSRATVRRAGYPQTVEARMQTQNLNNEERLPFRLWDRRQNQSCYTGACETRKLFGLLIIDYERNSVWEDSSLLTWVRSVSLCDFQELTCKRPWPHAAFTHAVYEISSKTQTLAVWFYGS